VLQQGTGGTSGTDPDGDGDPTATGSGTSTSASNQTFSQMLQSMRVTPQQFHADFLAAVQAAQGGKIDPSAVFQSFPPGSMVDTSA